MVYGWWGGAVKTKIARPRNFECGLMDWLNGAKLKTYQPSLGFYGLAIAALSMKEALEA